MLEFFPSLLYEKNLFTILCICRCEACLCSVLGSLGAACDPASGECSCRPGYTGHKCNICPDGGAERHGGCGQGSWGIHAKLFATKKFTPFVIELCFLCFPRVRKRLSIFPSPAGKSLTKLSLDGNINYSRAGRVWLGTSRLGTGKSITFFYSVP